MNNSVALVIEDHRDIADLFCSALEEAGFQVEIIADGNDALARLTEVTPNLITLDLNLPGTSGESILHQVRGNARLADTLVIVITAYGNLAETVQEEADLVLIKPVSLLTLRRLVARLYTVGDLPSDFPSIIGPGENEKVDNGS
jgi:DNA-binding response OmpR family regulator